MSIFHSNWVARYGRWVVAGVLGTLGRDRWQTPYGPYWWLGVEEPVLVHRDGRWCSYVVLPQ